LPKALSLTSITGTVAGLVGAVLGGAVVDRFDLTGAVVVNVFSYFLSLVLINNIKLKASPNLDQNQTPMDSISHTSANSTPLEGQSTPTFWERYTQIQILDPFPTPKKLLLLFAGVNFFLTPILVFLPIFTKQVLNGSGKTLGVLEASISVGILGGSLFFYKWNFAQSILKRVSLLLLCAGVSFTSIGFFDSPLPVAMSLLMIGLCLGSLNVQIVTYFQQQIPDALKARFFALLQAFVAVAIPFGYLMVGSLAAWIQWLPFFLGAGVVLMGVISIRIYKR
jgi:DHA3 family macrolide efflux protein-like MFS transporter